MVMTLSVTARAQEEGPIYRIVNQTGKFNDSQVFWSLDMGRSWHSLAEQSAVACPRGNGRLYFALGTPPANLGVREALWDFIEYASENPTTWHGNTTQVDGFCIPITIEMGRHKVGIEADRQKMFADFAKDAPEPFKALLIGDWRIVAPGYGGFGRGGPNADYFDKYIDDVWAMYAEQKPTPSGQYIGKVVDGALIFTPVKGGAELICKSKPSTPDAFMGTGVLATNAPFCAAINRHVLADPADWKRPETFYQTEPYNWYSKFLHDRAINRKAYGFCYDDYADQAAFFSGHGNQLTVTLHWDSNAQ